MDDFNFEKDSINLPKNLDEFEECINEPFCIFEKKNFLDFDLYNNLLLNFPSEEQFPASHSNGNKKFLNNKHEEFFKFIKGNIWGDFYEKLNSKKVCFKFLSLINNELKKIEDRQNLKNYLFIKDYRNQFFHRSIYKILKTINFNLVRIGFEFSIIKKDCFIPPHCDTENKLLSLMIYFPPEDNDPYFSSYENLGTNFYKLKKTNTQNLDNWKSKYLDQNISKKFFENYELFYNSKFEKNKLTGFIKSDKSWHDVKKFEKDLIRKSVNINIYLI